MRPGTEDGTFPAWRNDARAKVTGRARFTDDLKVPGTLHAVPVYTDHVHARIRKIDTARARAATGVVRVITARDVPGENTCGLIVKDTPILAEGLIRSEGDVVALVVARDRRTARAAAGLVVVDAEELPAVLDVDEALKPGAPLVHGERGTNVTNHHKIRRGDVEKGFAASDIIIEKEFSTQRVEHAYLEPEAALCEIRADGVVSVRGSMQHPFSTRRFVAAFLGLPLAGVAVECMPMGGGFGGKDDTAAFVCARAALAAILTSRPVKMTYDRAWSMRESYKRHSYRVKYKMGLSRDGIIRACEVRALADAGAYCSVTPFVTWRSAVQCCGPYRVENVRGDVLGVYTNNVFTGAMRGFGSPQINFCIEQMIDLAAEGCGMSPLKIRKLNILRQGDETITGQVLDGHTVSASQVMDSVSDRIGYKKKLKNCARGKGEEDELYGIGLAVSYRGMSLGAEGMDFSAAIVNVQFDGSILLDVSIHENGQGAESAMILLLADELGVSRERIRHRRSSTSAIPDGGTTVASRGTLMGGGAVVDAARKLGKVIARVVAKEFDCPVDTVSIRGDRVYGDSRSLSFDEAVHLLFLAQEFPYAFGSFKAPPVSWNKETGVGKAYFTYVYGCQAVELTVNRRTGRVTLQNAVAAHDVGRALNPPMVLGQFFGGMAMGIGYALHEEVLLKGGRVTNADLNSYRIPRARHLPEMTGIIVENADPNSPSGAKGIGEPTNELMAPAIANAIANATGRRPFVLPIVIGVEDGR
jgi:CO/xanthine dehydrogenase Mo-binding subunit